MTVHVCASTPQTHHIYFRQLTDGKIITVYAQQELVKDLIAHRLAKGGRIAFAGRVTDSGENYVGLPFERL
jgi:hypothetical protein